MAAIVSVKDAVKNYTLGKVVVPALRGVTLEVGAGEFLSIAGPSGSGKTTLLNLIGCVDTPTSGTVEVAGKDTRELSERAAHRPAPPHHRVHLPELQPRVGAERVPEHRAAAAAAAPARPGRAQAACSSCSSASASREYAKHRPSELSGGQRQRVAIARALVTRPQLVLADEPTANLDSVTGQNILDLMKELNRTEGTTFIFSTHDQKVMAYASAIVRLADGKLAAGNGTPAAAPHVAGAPA